MNFQHSIRRYANDELTNVAANFKLQFKEHVRHICSDSHVYDAECCQVVNKTNAVGRHLHCTLAKMNSQVNVINE